MYTSICKVLLIGLNITTIVIKEGALATEPLTVHVPVLQRETPMVQ